MRILTVCKHGNSRSVCLAWMLKQYGHETLSCGFKKVTVSTLAMLCQWAEKIVVMEKDFVPFIPDAFQDKVTVCDVGPDVYFKGYDETLISKSLRFMHKQKLDVKV